MNPRECLEQLEKAIRENQLTQVKKTLDSEVEFNTEKVSFLDWISINPSFIGIEKLTALFHPKTDVNILNLLWEQESIKNILINNFDKYVEEILVSACKKDDPSILNFFMTTKELQHTLREYCKKNTDRIIYRSFNIRDLDLRDRIEVQVLAYLKQQDCLGAFDEFYCAAYAVHNLEFNFADFILKLYRNYDKQEKNTAMAKVSENSRQFVLEKFAGEKKLGGIRQPLEYSAYSSLLNSNSNLASSLLQAALLNENTQDAYELIRQCPHICDNYEALKKLALYLSKKDFWTLLDQYPTLFACAERHYEEKLFSHIDDDDEPSLCAMALDNYTQSLVEKIQEKMEKNQPLDEQDIIKCLIALRYFIRRNESQFIKPLKALLAIPQIREKVQCNCLDLNKEDNELFRLALRYGNKEAYLELFKIEAVEKLTKSNRYYINEILGCDEDLAKNVGFKESSMVAFDASERQTLQELTNHYKDEFDHLGAPAIIKDLVHYLEEQYQKAPIQFRMPNNEIIPLPLDYASFWTRFKDEKPEIRQEAFIGYCKNMVHTCWRYFQKPNYWLKSNTEFEHPSQSTFNGNTEYDSQIDLIATCWLAAKDEKCKGKHSVEERISIFWGGIAEVARAHNWDNYRESTTGDAKEQYDDFLGDNPSCRGGTPRRIFQSLGDHPLIREKINPTEVEYSLYKAIANFYLDYLKKLRHEKALKVLETADDLMNLIEEDYSLMEEHNIPLEKITEIKEHLIQQYGEPIRHYLELKFFIDLKSTCHLTYFLNELISFKVVARASNGDLALGTALGIVSKMEKSEREEPPLLKEERSKPEEQPKPVELCQSESSEINKAESEIKTPAPEEEPLIEELEIIKENPSDKDQGLKIECRRQIIEKATEALKKIIADLKVKIGSVDKHRFRKAYYKSRELLEGLTLAKDNYLKDLSDIEKPFTELNNLFQQQCMTLIKEATPLLERDLGWGSYLTNLLKSITNVLFKVITFGKNSSFFTLTHSESLKAVEDAQGQLKLKL